MTLHGKLNHRHSNYNPISNYRKRCKWCHKEILLHREKTIWQAIDVKGNPHICKKRYRH